MITIKEISEKANVSTTTVSNVINGKTSHVSKSVIEKIESEEMGAEACQFKHGRSLKAE